ncbi:hypothetical protein [Labilibacter marinus]|uniref:hypothetical protein n=1 Tax=Labilibacter marinus TaxID=1477105 RepID=UPI00117ABDA4|nr:hypothetical protein [Labilibacter marinus]
MHDVLKDKLNYGYDFRGRDTYMNNGLYPVGSTHKGLMMGTPLFHTVEQADVYSKSYGFNNFWSVVNNRVEGFYLGIEGCVNEKLSYAVKCTTTINKGSYQEQYINIYS